VLHFGNGSEPTTLDPGTMNAAVESTIASSLFEGLINIAIDGKTILPGVAESWELSDDKLRYTFHLRSDARWSDGTPVTADDFLFGFRRACDPDIGCQIIDEGFSIAGVYDYVNGRNHSPESLGFRVIDAHTFEVRLAHPAPYILYVFGQNPFMPVPRAVVERYGKPFDRDNPWSKPGSLVSNGAFMLKSWQPNANVTVVRNPYYWDRAEVKLNEVRFYPTDDPDTEEHGFRAGEFHITFRVPISKVAAYAAEPNTPLRISPQLATWFLVFNTRKPPFDNVKVRRAFSLVVDREKVVSAVLHQVGTPAHSLTRPGCGGVTFPAVADHDPDLARKLLAEAGYPGGSGFPKVEFTVRSSGTDPIMAEALQQLWLRELGVQVTIGQKEPKVAISGFYAGDYQFGLNSWFPGIDSPEFTLTLARGGSPSNMSGWQNADFDQAFHDADFATNPETHAAACVAMEKIIFDEAPYSPVYYFNQPQLVSPSLHGWQGNLIQQTDFRALSVGDGK
jgi:oligopeptide transport system substrate-binding protein